MRHPRLALLIALVVWILAGSTFRPTARANGGLSTPVPPPGPPRGTSVPMHPLLWSQVPGSPRDFHFTHFELYGQFFNPGEQVTITAEHVPIPPVTVTADQNGQFFAYVDFTWVFCGPHGVSQPAPVFHAAGSLGSSGTLTLFSRPCPELVTSQNLASNSQGGESGGAIISGTAVSVPVVGVSTAVPGPAPTFAPGQQATRGPGLGLTAMQTRNVVEGFGFQPGERVIVKEVDSPADTPTPASTVADSQGEFEATMMLYVPGPCMPVTSPPEVVATGDRGSSASARPAYPPMPMYPCSLPIPTVTAVPTPTPTMQTSRPSVVLTPKVASAGTRETAEIQAPGAGKVRLTIRYPHRGAVRWTVTATSPASFRVQWKVPRTAQAGRATFEALFLPDNIVLRKTFTIR